MIAPRITREGLALGAFGALIAIGCGLRFWRIAELGFWYDELWAVVGAHGRPLSEVYREWMLGDSHPPGFFLANFLWFKVAPATELWARLPHALASVLTVVFLLAGTRRVLSRDERVLAAALFSLCYLSIHYSLEVKQYSWVLLLSTIATTAYVESALTRGLSGSSGGRLGAAAVGLVWLDYFAMVYAALLLASLPIVLRGAREARRAALKLAVVCGVCSFPVAPFLYYQVIYAPGGWQRPSAGEFVPVYLASLFFMDMPWVTGGLIALGGGLLISRRLTPRPRAAEAPPAAMRERSGHPQVPAAAWSPGTKHLLAVWAAMTVLLVALGLWQPILYPRYFLVTFPALIMLLAIAVHRACPLRGSWLALLPLVFFVKAAIVDAETVRALRRQEWDKSVEFVLARARPEDRVFVLGADPRWTSFEYLQQGDVDGVFYVKNVHFYEYYFERRGALSMAEQLEVVEPTVEGAHQLLARFRDTGARVFVLAGHHIAFDPDAQAALEAAASRVETASFQSTLVYTFTF